MTMIQTLTQLFDAGRASLEEKLCGMTLPEDASRIRKIVEGELTALMAPKSDFSMSLTTAENAVLQQIVGLMDVRRQLTGQITAECPPRPKAEMRNTPAAADPTPRVYPIVGSAVGGSVGALLGPWTAVVGAVVGTSLAAYSRDLLPVFNSPAPKSVVLPSAEKKDREIDPKQLTDIIRGVCGQIDHLIALSRQQIQDLKSIYENREKVSLSRNYRFLLESIQSVLGSALAPDDAGCAEKLRNRCGQLADSLENYGLRVAVYDESAPAAWFDTSASERTSVPVTKLPAILEGEEPVLKGKVILPVNKQ